MNIIYYFLRSLSLIVFCPFTAQKSERNFMFECHVFRRRKLLSLISLFYESNLKWISALICLYYKTSNFEKQINIKLPVFQTKLHFYMQRNFSAMFTRNFGRRRRMSKKFKINIILPDMSARVTKFFCSRDNAAEY